jgi:hypothetical protein
MDTYDIASEYIKQYGLFELFKVDSNYSIVIPYKKYGIQFRQIRNNT